MDRMKAMESYPKNAQAPDNNADDEAVEYEHAQDVASRGSKCGTLSKSEWEAACKCLTHAMTNFRSCYVC